MSTPTGRGVKSGSLCNPPLGKVGWSEALSEPAGAFLKEIRRETWEMENSLGGGVRGGAPLSMVLNNNLRIN